MNKNKDTVSVIMTIKETSCFGEREDNQIIDNGCGVM